MPRPGCNPCGTSMWLLSVCVSGGGAVALVFLDKHRDERLELKEWLLGLSTAQARLPASLEYRLLCISKEPLWKNINNDVASGRCLFKMNNPYRSLKENVETRPYPVDVIQEPTSGAHLTAQIEKLFSCSITR